MCSPAPVTGPTVKLTNVLNSNLKNFGRLRSEDSPQAFSKVLFSE
jgi:hypothetical protein